MKFCKTTALLKISSLKKRIRCVAGGTGASKTISILSWLVDAAQNYENLIITTVAESVPHLQLGAIRDFKNIMQFNGYWEEDRWNESKHIYTFETGTIIEFISFDKFGKAHGPRRDILFLNEANNIPYGIADQLITRTRKIVWMDWNPSEEFWAYTELIPSRKDLDFITLTYLDNEGLDNISRQEIESHRHNKQWWTVYGEGRLGEITSRIYTNWAKLDEIPHEARLERRWLDFGYTNDPSAIGDIYYYNGGWILDEQLYQKGMSNKQIADFLNSLSSKNTLVIADSAEPKSIDEIRSYGLNVIPSQKGPDSVRAGIQLVQDQPISVTRRSVNVWKEYNNYLFLVDKNDKILNEEDPKCANHHMSGIRYALSTLGRLKQEVSYWDRIFDDKKINKNIINRGK
jgi:phage terminase large subunit